MISPIYRWARLGTCGALALFIAACGGGGDGGTDEPTLTPAQISAVSAVPQSAPTGSPLGTPLTVIVNDSRGRPMASVVVTFRVTAGNGTLSAGAGTTDAAGQASTTFTLGSNAGTNEVTASVTGVAATAKFSITGIPASACTTPVGVNVGQVVTDITNICLGGSAGQDYTAIVVGMSPTALARTTVEIAGSSLGTPPASLNIAALTSVSGPKLGAPRPERNDALEAALIDRQAREVAPMVAGARSWYARRTPQTRGGAFSQAPVPATARIGDVYQLNMNGRTACSAAGATNRNAVVKAVGQKSIILADTANPSSNFSDSDFQFVVDLFDQLVDPVNRAAFGDVTDIDNNGRVLILYTKTINELTPANSQSYVGGLTAPRDLIPVTGGSQPCPNSNAGEIFYMLAADTGGVVNGNKYSRDFILDVTVSTIAHEYQHLINFARRTYITPAPYEELFLNEGMSHAAEELLFYRASGLSPRSNLGGTSIITNQHVNAFNDYFIGSFLRYDDYVSLTSISSPYMPDDSLTTRGATPFFLRYAVDRAASSDGNFWARLVTGPATGRANLRSVLGLDDPGLQAWFRDFAVSVWADDAVAVESKYTQPSWNIRSIYPRITSNPPIVFPLVQRGLSDGVRSQVTLNGGSFAVYRLSTVAGANATVQLTGANGSALPPGTLVTLALIRTR